MDTLKEFILAEMHKRSMSEREFSRLVGVAHTTINYLINQEKKAPREVTVSFIVKLARATNNNPILLLMLAFPELKPDLKALVGLPTSSAMRLKQIEDLPEGVVEIIDAFLMSAAATRERKNDVKGE